MLVFYTKNTAYTAILLHPAVILFSLLRGKIQKFAWAILAASLVLLLVITLRFDEAAKWYRATDQLICAFLPTKMC